ncbi:hypothetical protein CGCF415_v003773 [Colletotrichum fructicola]|nr:hypothetical protein CGCF415_v003773 [Colletotrichum fructicola]
MQNHDPQDEFAELCHRYKEYPKFQLHTQSPQEAWYNETQWDKLQEKEKTVFCATHENIDVWETGGLNKFPAQETSISGVNDLKQHLIRSDKDPIVRHLFLASPDSRSPLNCSVDMFKFACAYHQVDPYFLESLHAFGEQDEPVDLCLSQFRGKNILSANSNESRELKKLGRSGRETRVSYLLRSVEFSENEEEGLNWKFRQTANYHSFDLKTGRALWINIKGSELFKERILQFRHLLNVPPKTELNEGDISHHLQVSLATHVIYLSWCDENWRQFINDIEGAVKRIIAPAREALVDDHVGEDGLEIYPKLMRETISRKSTTNSKTSPSKTNTMVSGTTVIKSPMLSRMMSATSSTLRSWTRTQTDLPTDLEKGPPQGTSADNASSSSLGLDPRGMLKDIRFKHMQSLHHHSEIIQKSMLILELNVGVLKNIGDHYDNLAATEFKDMDACKAVINEFLREIASISKMLETRSRQLKCLAANLEQGISLYDKALQQRSDQINTKLAEYAQKNSEQMQIISDKTSRQTTSMHVITVATLFFLPATFVATFFQSGVFLWNEETPEDMQAPFKWQGDNFRLFIKITIPLTIVTIGTWLFVYLRLRWRTSNLYNMG